MLTFERAKSESGHFHKAFFEADSMDVIKKPHDAQNPKHLIQAAGDCLL